MRKINKKIVVLIISIFMAVAAIMVTTYALFTSEAVADNPSNYTTGLLSITANSKSENISLTNELPKTDEEGLASEPYVFTITNQGNLDYKFDIKLLSTSSSNFSAQYIKLKVDDEEITTLSSLTNGIIKSDVVLSAGASIDISIRLWLSSDTPNSEIGKNFTSQIVTDGQAIYTVTNLINHINKLYTDAPKEEVINNSITYNYAPSVNLMEDADGNIRYYGANPNNYIYFNCSDYSNQSSATCEVWRIIGVFGDNLKIMRSGSIGSYSWDNKNDTSGSEGSYGKNDWSDARIMKLLNPGYTTQSIGGSLYYNSKSGNCYANAANAYTSCNFTNSGLKNETTRALIEEMTWNLGAHSSAGVYPNQIYQYERGTTVYSGRPTTWEGKIALPYASDYAYAVDLNSCKSQLASYNNSSCTSTNWMKPILGTSSLAWLLNTSQANSHYVWYVNSTGNLSYNSAYGLLGIFPTAYLSSSLAISSGSGASFDPYRLMIIN